MAGVIAALEDCKTDYCFVTAADLADLSTEIITLLVDMYNNQQYLGLRESGGVQPLCGIYHKSALDVFYNRAQKADFGMTRAVKAMNHKGVILPAGQWRNINCPEDLGTGSLND
jgi:molybdopterin-guanine dinucleotide biosynthesis protein A